MSVLARIIDAIAEVWLVALALLVVLVALVGLRRFRLAVVLFAASLFALAVYKRLTTPAMPDVEVMRQEQVAPPLSAVGLVPVELLAVDQLAVRGGGAPFTFVGTVSNQSTDYEVTSITLRARRLDCHDDALDSSGCDILWEREKWIEMSLPPQQTQRFSVTDWARDTPPRPRGTTRDELDIVRAVGREVVPPGGS